MYRLSKIFSESSHFYILKYVVLNFFISLNYLCFSIFKLNIVSKDQSDSTADKMLALHALDLSFSPEAIFH